MVEPLAAKASSLEERPGMFSEFVLASQRYLGEARAQVKYGVKHGEAQLDRIEEIQFLIEHLVEFRSLALMALRDFVSSHERSCVGGGCQIMGVDLAKAAIRKAEGQASETSGSNT